VNITVDNEPRFAPGDMVRLRVAHDIHALVLETIIYERGMTTYRVSWIDSAKRQVELVGENEVEAIL
jgi:hypothetical protein